VATALGRHLVQPAPGAQCSGRGPAGGCRVASGRVLRMAFSGCWAVTHDLKCTPPEVGVQRGVTGECQSQRLCPEVCMCRECVWGGDKSQGCVSEVLTPEPLFCVSEPPVCLHIIPLLFCWDVPSCHSWPQSSLSPASVSPGAGMSHEVVST
jgi:hypothetical protein